MNIWNEYIKLDIKLNRVTYAALICQRAGISDRLLEIWLWIFWLKKKKKGHFLTSWETVSLDSGPQLNYMHLYYYAFISRWLFYLLRCFNIQSSAFCPQQVLSYMFCTDIRTAIIFLYITWAVFITATESAYCEVRAESLDTIHANLCQYNLINAPFSYSTTSWPCNHFMT